MRRASREAVHLIDATRIRLSDLSAAWANYGSCGASVKIHVDYSVDGGVPTHFDITPARINDITIAKTLEIKPGETYVFDLGCYDFAWFSKLRHANCHFVARLKNHTRPRVLEERPVVSEGSVRADRLIKIDGRLKLVRAHHNPFTDTPLREVEVVIGTGKTLRILTNDLNATAEQIANLYKMRWRIELFFRWVKQHLKIKHLLGGSETAVSTQISVAMIACRLLKMACKAQADVPGLLTFARLVRANLLHLRSIHNLSKPPPPIGCHPRHQEFVLC